MRAIECWGRVRGIIGALTIDRGLRETRRFLRRFIEHDEAEMVAELRDANPKGRLQEFLQERYRLAPVYQTVNEEGPAHARTFTCAVLINGRSLGVGSGGSKRDAEQAAAAVALAALESPEQLILDDGASNPESAPARPRRKKRP